MATTTSNNGKKLPDPLPGIDFASLPWNLNEPDKHVYVHITTSTDWSDEDAVLQQLETSVHDYQTSKSLDLSPATTSLNYGTSLWEGLKAYRVTPDEAVVFRADQNYQRMKNGAAELCLPMPSQKVFMRAIQLAIQKNATLLPPVGDGMKLYVRPMLLGTGQQLGLYRSPEISFLVYVSPTGNYFKAATEGLNLHLETRRSRASRGGMGAVKCSGNYAAALKPLTDCKQHGFHDNIFLELETLHTNNNSNIQDAILQELSAANIFVVLSTGEIVTPALERRTILPGVTRLSIIELVQKFAAELQPAMAEATGNPDVTVTVTARDVTVGELETHAREVFATGTAAELVPIRRIATSPDDAFQFDVTFPYGKDLPGGPVTTKLLGMIRQAMSGERKMDGWLRNPMDAPEQFCSH